MLNEFEKIILEVLNNYSQCLRNVCWLMNCTLRREEIFHEDTDSMTCVRRMVEMRPYMRFNRDYHYILTITDMLSKYVWAKPLKAKSGNEMTKAIAKIIRDDRRCPKNLYTEERNFITQMCRNS